MQKSPRVRMGGGWMDGQIVLPQVGIVMVVRVGESDSDVPVAK